MEADKQAAPQPATGQVQLGTTARLIANVQAQANPLIQLPTRQQIADICNAALANSYPNPQATVVLE